MDIHHLRVFASVFKNRSFSKASEELHLTQPTISNHIKALEDEFDCKLFDRLGRTILPTKEAEVLYSHSMELIERTNNLREAVGLIKKDISGKLIIGASTIPGVYLLPGFMSEFRKKFPSISFQILISDSKGILENILRHELLLGIVGAKLGNEHIKYMPFIEDELIVVSSPHLSKNRMMTLQELLKFPMVLREEGSGTRKETEKFLANKGISLENVHISGVFGSTDAIKQAVKAGLGVSILSKFSVADELKYKILEEIKLTDIQMKRRFYIVTHKKRTLPRLYETFLNYIVAESKNF
ncbi:MAG: selenium metabolism-associated LysR family transcriptional regulator [Thermodesulfovibrionales bacterium]